VGQRILKISGTVLPLLLSGERHYRITGDEVPADARIVNVTLEFHWFQGPPVAVFLLESEEWSPIRDGGQIPEVSPMITELRPPSDPS
jgi:hypothetical protein